MDRVQRKAQQTEIESLKNTIESMKAAADARENEVAKLKHEVGIFSFSFNTRTYTHTCIYATFFMLFYLYIKNVYVGC